MVTLSHPVPARRLGGSHQSKEYHAWSARVSQTMGKAAGTLWSRYRSVVPVPVRSTSRKLEPPPVLMEHGSNLKRPLASLTRVQTQSTPCSSIEFHQVAVAALAEIDGCRLVWTFVGVELDVVARSQVHS